MGKAAAAKRKRTFVLGAGASVHAGGPLVGQLLDFRSKHNDRTDHFRVNVLDPLMGFGLEVNRFNFEELLTEIDLHLVASKRGSVEHQRLRDCRQALVGSVMARCAQVHDTAAVCRKLCGQFGLQDKVVTFNYDVMIEDMLAELGRWNPSVGYGFWSLLDPKSRQSIGDVVQVLKPHGSVNWDVGKDGAEAGYVWIKGRGFKRTPDLAHISLRGPPIPADEDGSALLAPSFIKPFAQANPFLREAWHQAYARMRETGELWIIGYSIPEADVDAQLLLSAISASANIRVVDPNARQVALRMQRLVGNSPIAYNNLTFAELSGKTLDDLKPEGEIK